MFVYVGKNFSATVAGTRRLEVRCERCGTDYFFELVREGHGSASAPYYIGQASAAGRAHRGAEKDLAKRLLRESELVPCPKCHWISKPLVKGFARTRFRWLGMAGVILGIGVGIALMISMATERHSDPATTFTVPWIIAAFIGIGGFVLRAFLRGLINPNKRFPNRPIVPEGTPRGLTAADLKNPPPLPDGKYQQEDPSMTAYPDWVVFKAGELDLPREICCECLAPASTFYKPPMTVNGDENELKPPLCVDCRSRLRGSWWLWNIASIAGSVALIALAVFINPIGMRGDPAGRIALYGVFGFFVMIFAMIMVPIYVTRPYVMRTIDRSRSIFRIRFRSEQYTEAVRQSRDRIRAKSVATLNAPMAMVAPPPPR